jgi:hypothetical protein
MDETAVAYGYAGIRGTMLRRNKKTQPDPNIRENIPLSQCRGKVTLAAFIASDHEVQRLLPQCLFGATNKLNHKDIRDVRHLVPPWLNITHGPKVGWVTEELMLAMLELLAAALSLPSLVYRFILVLDAYRPHMSHRISASAREKGIWLMYVPGGMTGLLQPLDFLVFKPFKGTFQEGLARRRARDPLGCLSTSAWFLEVVLAIQRMRMRDWSRAFSKCGLDATQANLSTYARSLVHELTMPVAAQNPPSEADVKVLLGRKHLPFYDEVVFHRPRPQVNVVVAHSS